MDQTLINQKIEDTISDCNRILAKWFLEGKYYLINEHEIKGAIFNRLKIYCGIWRDQKHFLKMLRVNIQNSQILDITLIDLGDSYGNNIREKFNSIFSKINYKSLMYNYGDNSKPQRNDLSHINFKQIEQIKF